MKKTDASAVIRGIAEVLAGDRTFQSVLAEARRQDALARAQQLERETQRVRQEEENRKAALAAGWKPGVFRSRAENGGWVVEESRLVSGKAVWERVFYSRNQADVNKKLARCQAAAAGK